MRKKRVLFHSDSSLAKTGFGRNAKEVLTYLYNTGKYEIVEYCCNKHWSRDPEHIQKPWPSYGTLPDNLHEIEHAPDHEKKMAAYGEKYLDKIVEIAKPDVYFAIQDIWGIEYAIDKHWFENTTPVFWTTLDSLPILRSAIEVASKVKNYWVWSKFAQDALNKMGYEQVQTIHGAIDSKAFYRKSDEEKEALRRQHGIPSNAFVIGFVFRNQPRKSVPQLLEAFSAFKKDAPEVKNPKLLLHTSWIEGWDIRELAEHNKVDLSDIYTTYVCHSCRSYKVQNFSGEENTCPFCGKEKMFFTCHPRKGITEEQLNEVYNLMDVYCHPFTSGGQEIPIQEAKFAELITLVTNYSCGEEMCLDEAYSLPLAWTQYFEAGSNFIKASTTPYSIVKQLKKVVKMDPKQRKEWGKKAREWALNNFSTQSVAKKIEEFIDSVPYSEYDFTQKKNNPNPLYQIENADKLSNEEWVMECILNILGNPSANKHSFLVRNLSRFLESSRANRAKIEEYFRKTAAAEFYKNKKEQFFQLLKQDESNKICYVMPQSERDLILSSSLFSNLKKKYPNYKLYVATKPEYFNIVNGHPAVDHVIEFFPEMENPLFMEGIAEHKGHFNMVFLPHFLTQKAPIYIHNSED